MSSYRITLKDRTTEHIDDADAYQQEGQMTTFFQLGDGRHVVDTWSVRMASFRTSEILAIRRLDHREDQAAPASPDARASVVAEPLPLVAGLRSA